MMKNDEQIEELKKSFKIFIFKEEVIKELRKKYLNGKDNFGFFILFCRKTISVFLQITFKILVI